eukprot:Nitzschia sp. Nitz4//scaffold63_size106090//46229//49405//NITZ4_004390-RA/size106090-processed-gene-0.125-mRNA-1//1//CDS//3329555975//7119//frame0
MTSNISILGRSDALLSRGLLTMLANYVSNNLTVAQLLELHPQRVADVLGVRSALTVGRNDGLANMVQQMQQQVRQQLQNKESGTWQPQSQPNHTVVRSATLPNTEIKPSVALLLSGGVDSSVALHLLLEQGYNVTAFYLKIWLDEESSHLAIHECPWEDDMSVCQQVCDHLGTEWNCTVPLVVLSLQDEYYQHVMQHTLTEASKGRTPNPDVLCNERVKFGYFLQHIQETNHRRKLQQLPTFDYIASGHYAQLVRPSIPNISDSSIRKNAGPIQLLRAPDPVKDQSYFLSSLNQSQLERLLFPIGHLPKSEVRELACRLNLPNRQRPDSQGLCFLGKVSFSAFLENSLGTNPGDVRDVKTGEVVGRHEGIWFHTVGQRKGLGPVMHATQTHRGPWYVAAKSPVNNTIYVTNKYNERFLESCRSECCVEQIHWIAGHVPINATEIDENMLLLDPVYVKIRHGPRIAQGSLRWNQKTNTGNLRLETKDVVGGVVVVGTLEVTTNLPSQGRSSLFYHTVADQIITPLLRRVLTPEQAHDLTIQCLQRFPNLVPTHRPSSVEQSLELQQVLWGDSTPSGQTIRKVTFANPIGLAAGFDKDAQAIQPLLDLGFGFVEVGSVTPLPQPGNPSPRMFRLLEDQAIINRYGFNSKGVDAMKVRLMAFRYPMPPSREGGGEVVSTPTTASQLWSLVEPIWKSVRARFTPPAPPVVVGVNLGKNKTSETPLEDYQTLIQQLGPLADYLVINVSSPNTPGLRDLQDADSLETLLRGCIETRNQIPEAAIPPLLVKLSPDLTDQELEDIAKVLVDLGVDGIILTNTTTKLAMQQQLQSEYRYEIGGLSGRPLHRRSTECIRLLYAATEGKVPIIGVGGIFTAHDVYEKICAGASVVQIYSAMVYEGPGLVSRLRDEVAQLVRDNGYRRLDQVVGSDHEALHWKRQQSLAKKRMEEFD